MGNLIAKRPTIDWEAGQPADVEGQERWQKARGHCRVGYPDRDQFYQNWPALNRSML